MSVPFGAAAQGIDRTQRSDRLDLNSATDRSRSMNLRMFNWPLRLRWIRRAINIDPDWSRRTEDTTLTVGVDRIHDRAKLSSEITHNRH